MLENAEFRFENYHVRRRDPIYFDFFSQQFPPCIFQNLEFWFSFFKMYFENFGDLQKQRFLKMFFNKFKKKKSHLFMSKIKFCKKNCRTKDCQIFFKNSQVTEFLRLGAVHGGMGISPPENRREKLERCNFF